MPTTPADPIAIVLDPEVFAVLEAATALTLTDAAEVETAHRFVHEAKLSPPARAAVLTQLELRRQAHAKFDHYARSMVFTRDGLEQATRLNVAALHADRFRSAGCQRVADLGCGIGANSVALAALGMSVQAWDRDPQAVAATAMNLRFFPNCSTHLGDVTTVSLPSLVAEGVDALFADPARRSGAQHGSRRLFDPRQWSPPLPEVLAWREVMRDLGCDNVGVKVAPGLDYQWIPADFHAQWVSVNGVLVDASLWSPGVSPEGPGRTARIMGPGGTLTLTCSSNPSAAAPTLPVAPLADYLWEPDPAVIRAGLLAQFASQAGALGVISPSIAYLTASDLPDSGWACACRVFEVLDVTSLKPKAVTAALRMLVSSTEDALPPSDIEVKKRGADVDPQVLRKALLRGLVSRGMSGGGSAGVKGAPLTVFATRVAGRHRAVIARRVRG